MGLDVEWGSRETCNEQMLRRGRRRNGSDLRACAEGTGEVLHTVFSFNYGWDVRVPRFSFSLLLMPREPSTHDRHPEQNPTDLLLTLHLA